MSERIIRKYEVALQSGKSPSTIYLRIKQGLFPKPIRLGPRMVGWRESEVAAINAAHIRGASTDELRALVVALENSRKVVACGVPT